MFQKFIKKMKAKPEPIRKSITLGVSLGITGVVGFFWLISFLNYSSEVLLAKPKTESPTSFLNKMGSLIGESYANVRSKIDTDSFINDENTTPEAVSATTSSATADVEVVSTTTINAKPANINTSDTTSSGVSLQDILTTKKQDNQENKATTSSEVLVQ